jgi:hypothetical protein
MSLVKLTKNLENFQWTDYEKAGSGKSPQSGENYFGRPSDKALEGMESKFGKLDTQPSIRGPYGVSNVMDGTKKGRGFIPPGGPPSGFTKNMDLFHNKSEYAIGQNLTLTPLSYEVAGVTSNLFYGQVDKKEINIEPAAEGAYGVTTLPISTYTSRQNLEGYTIAGIGGYNTFYGTIDSLSSKGSKFQKSDGSYTTPTKDEITKPGSSMEIPSFNDEKGGQRTFIIPAAYPQNTSAYTIDSQLGWSHSNNFLKPSGGPWGVLPIAWVETKTVTTTVPYTEEDMTKAENYMGGHVNDWMATHPQTYTETQEIIHPIQPINLHSVPNYNAPSWLELQFLTNYGVTNGIWPYKVLGFEGTHPLIKKEIGQRYPIGEGISDWMALQVLRTADDIERVEKWLDTPKGDLWIQAQHMLQDLNPREETRNFSLTNLKLSIPPMFHGNRHSGELLGWGGTYMEAGDFGSLYGDPDDVSTGFGSGLFGTLGNVASALGDVDFLESPDSFPNRNGRLVFLTDRFILGKSDDSILFSGNNIFETNLTELRTGGSLFGRPPKIPSQDVISQAGAFGRGDISTGKEPSGQDADSLIKRYWTLSYGNIPDAEDSSYSYMPDFKSDRQDREFMLDVGDGEFPIGPSDPFVNYSDGTTAWEDEYRDKRTKGSDIVKNIGQQGLQADPVVDTKADGAGLGLIKTGITKQYKNDLTDKVNMAPYGPWGAPDDFIKFKFYDIVNKRNIIFRAILSGISDSISPEWSGTRYIGRPDQVWVYQGVDRSVSFTFDVYPKTKQEFPVLMEKLNYLIGLCYPSYHNSRMIPPFINFTLGDMFVSTPGFLNSLSLEVDDIGTWEIEQGLQFPKHITCQCDFKYIGNHPQTSDGKHYELGWIPERIKPEQFWPQRDTATAMSSNLNIKKIFDDMGQMDDLNDRTK